MISWDNGDTWQDAGQATGDQGIAGTTPIMKIENGKWIVSFDGGTSWSDLGQATGEKARMDKMGLTEKLQNLNLKTMPGIYLMTKEKPGNTSDLQLHLAEVHSFHK